MYRKKPNLFRLTGLILVALLPSVRASISVLDVMPVLFEGFTRRIEHS